MDCVLVAMMLKHYENKWKCASIATPAIVLLDNLLHATQRKKLNAREMSEENTSMN